MNRVRNLATITAIVVPGVLAGATPAVAADTELAPTPPPKGPPVVYEDPAGDVDESVPDLISCAASEPWESLLSFRLEFAAAPPLSYDMETMTTDELWLMLLSGPEADPLTDSDQIEYAMIVHGATLPAEEETGSGLFDTTQPEGQEVFWRVVDVDVVGSVLTLSVDSKLVGDPKVVYFVAGVTSEGQEESDYDACPDLDDGPGEYELVGASLSDDDQPPGRLQWERMIELRRKGGRRHADRHLGYGTGADDGGGAAHGRGCAPAPDRAALGLHLRGDGLLLRGLPG